MQELTFTDAECVATAHFARNLEKRLKKAYQANARDIANAIPGVGIVILVLPVHLRWFKPWEWPLCPKGRLCPYTFRRSLIRDFEGIALLPVQHPVSGAIRDYQVLYRKPIPWADTPSPTPAPPAQVEDAEASPPPG